MTRRRTRTALIGLAAALLSLTLVSTASAAPSAKLRITKVGETLGAQVQGSETLLPGRVTNDGNKAARGKVRVKLADGTAIGSGRTAKVVKPGQGSDFSARLAVPADLAPGDYDLDVCVKNHAATASSCAPAGGKMKVIAEDPGPDDPGPVDAPSDCTSGAQTVGDRNFPEQGNGGYDAQHYDMFLDYNPVGNTLNVPTGGREGTHVAITAEATQDLCDFALDFNGSQGATPLQVDSITVNGVPATWTRVAPPGGSNECDAVAVDDTCHPSGSAALEYPPPNGCSPSFDNPGVNKTGCPASKLVITPATALADGATFVVDIAYHGTPGIHHDPDGSVEGWAPTSTAIPAPGTPDGAYVVNEPIGAYEWYPNNNHPEDKATYDFRITVPTGKTALGNGELLYYLDNGDGTTTWRWEMGYPMESAMSTATSGNFDLTSSIAANGVQYYNALDSNFTPTQKNSANVSLNQHSQITNYLTTIFGRYPFDSNGAVADNTSGSLINYVLEVQTKIHFPSSNVSFNTLVHETTHMWFGDSVSPSKWDEIWLNEGWATYAPWNYTQVVQNGTTMAAQFNSNYTAGGGTACPPASTGTNKWCIAPSDVDAQNTFTTFSTYTRHGMMLVALQQILGNTRFYNIAERYQAESVGSTMSTQEYFDLILEEAGKGAQGLRGPELAKLDQFLHQWILGTQIDPPFAFGNPKAPTITGTNFWPVGAGC